MPGWRWRAFNRGRMLVDRVYLTLIFWGPWNTIRVVVPFLLGMFFALKMARVIDPPTWLNVSCLVVLLADAVYVIHLGRKLIAAGCLRDNNEADPPP